MGVFGRKNREGRTAVEAALDDAWAWIQEDYVHDWYLDHKLRDLPSVAALVGAPDPERAEYLVALVQIAAQPSPKRESSPVSFNVLASTLAKLVTRGAITLDSAQIGAILLAAVESERDNTTGWAGSAAHRVIDPAIKVIEREAPEWGSEEHAELDPLLEAAIEATGGVVAGDLAARLNRVLRTGESGALPLHVLDLREDLGRRIAAALEASTESPDALVPAIELIDRLPSNGKASARWIASARAVVGELHDAPALVGELIEAMLTAENCVHHYEGTPHADGDSTWEYFSGAINEQFALGVLRLAGVVAAPDLLAPLSRTSRHMLVTIGGAYGSPRSVKLANAAVVAIADSALPASITELLALERAVRHGSLLNQIRKSIDVLATAQGVTRDELLEQAVEAHGLNLDGTLDVPLSCGSARIAASSRTATLVYLAPDGAVKTSFPAAVKEADELTLAALREELKGVRKTVAGERHRLDGLLVSEPSWAAEAWRRWYIDHPITGRLARDMIWRFETSDGNEFVGRPVDGATVLLDDGSSAGVPEGATVRLWHPALAVPTEVGAWRHHCLAHRVVQPVKQAYREVYVLTPAEHESRVYSNRFAAHVFRQVQARALMKGRGWKAPPLAWWDDGRDVGTATREYEHAGLRAEFFYDPIVEIEPDGGDLYPLCTSDQVRFVRDGEDAPTDLAEVPRLVFSEVMRDADLFIGVTSIGADPEWEDRGEGAIVARLNQYWNDFSFGELSAAAEIRRELIAGLLPALAIANRCQLEERFLRVSGDLRTYRIHLGSGNIQMDPNAEYLCIVTARSSKARSAFVPFDDDPILSLILSKAFLLAEDTKIKDETILAQIQRR